MKPLAAAAKAILATVDGRWQVAKLHLIEVSADRSHIITCNRRTPFESTRGEKAWRADAR
jgi:hypothetical protein